MMTGIAIRTKPRHATDWAAASVGFLPFVVTVKLPPAASFWAEWVAAVACIALLLFGWRQSEQVTKHQARVPVAALALVAVAVLVALQLLVNSPQFAGAAFLSIALASLAAWLCAAASTWRDRAPQVLDGFASGLLAALVANFAALLLELSGWHVHAWSIYPSQFIDRASALVGQPNQLATFAVMAWCAAHYLWWRGALPASGHALASVAVACLVAASASRAGSLTWILAFALAMLGLRGHADGRVGRRLLLVAVVAFAGAQIAWGPLGQSAYFAHSDAGAVTLVRQTREGRLELWRDSLLLIAQHPLFGVGWRNFSAARWNELSTPMFESNMGHAHNLVLNLAVEFGIVGALVILLPVGWAVWRALRVGMRRRAAAHDWFLAGLLVVISTYSMLEYPLWYAFFLLPFALALGLADGPAITLPVGRLRRPAHYGLGVLALAVAVLVGLDYRRIERIYTEAEVASGTSGRSVARLPAKQINDIALLTSIDLYAELMLIRVLDPDGLMMEQKLRISERVLGGLVNKETVARHIGFLLAAGKEDEAQALFERTGRNPDLQRETLEVLQQLSKQQPALVLFVDGHRKDALRGGPCAEGQPLPLAGCPALVDLR